MTTPVCAADELAPGEKRLIRGARRELVLCRAGDGAYYAVGAVCPHQGAPLARGTLDGTAVAGGVGRYEYGLDGEVLRCPWHAWEFDVKTGRSLFGDESARIATYEVTVDGNAVYVADTATKRRQPDEKEELA